MESRQNIIHDQIVSRIRTHVPILIGALVSWLRLKIGWTFDAETEAALITFTIALTISLYYELARLLESKVPWLGILLGAKGQPKYSTNQKRMI